MYIRNNNFNVSIYYCTIDNNTAYKVENKILW